MAGPLTIQRIPRGVLDFLGLRGTGDLPNNIAEAISGSVDLSSLYALNVLISVHQVSGAIGLGLNPATTPMTVPNGEMWVVMQTGALVTTVAASTCTWALVYDRAVFTGGSSAYHYLSQSIDMAASQVRAAGVTFQFGQLCLNPGDRLGIQSQAQAGTAPTATFALDYFRFLL